MAMKRQRDSNGGGGSGGGGGGSEPAAPPDLGVNAVDFAAGAPADLPSAEEAELAAAAVPARDVLSSSALDADRADSGSRSSLTSDTGSRSASSEQIRAPVPRRSSAAGGRLHSPSSRTSSDNSAGSAGSTGSSLGPRSVSAGDSLPPSSAGTNDSGPRRRPSSEGAQRQRPPPPRPRRYQKQQLQELKDRARYLERANHDLRQQLEATQQWLHTLQMTLEAHGITMPSPPATDSAGGSRASPSLDRRWRSRSASPAPLIEL